METQFKDSDQEAKPGSLKADPETLKEISHQMGRIINNGLWGYKNKTSLDQRYEREISLKSEAAAEKLFAYLYANNPANAKKQWQYHSGKAPDSKMIDRAESTIIKKNAEKALPRLIKMAEESILASTGFRSNQFDKNKKEQLKSIKYNMLDAKLRAQQLRRNANKEIFKNDEEVDGMTVLKKMFAGATHVRRDIMASFREGGKARAFGKLLKDLNNDISKGIEKTLSQKVSPDFAKDFANNKLGDAMVKLVANVVMKGHQALMNKIASNLNKAAQARKGPQNFQKTASQFHKQDFDYGLKR